MLRRRLSFGGARGKPTEAQAATRATLDALAAQAWVAPSAWECRALGYSRAERSALNRAVWALLGAPARTAYARRGGVDRDD